ncbi:hypothetical protein QJ133_02255 [Priestia megaterium]|uniref:hypothetical protein n=1 Tax=Priestia megaterium TaxID=1404 RepID=UPI00249CDD4C|nr:hypothetical protein [Priestia megaterium]MDI3089999.1 hypothetical protein [Priestia megaterium]
MLDKFIDIITNDNHDKLTDYILRIANTAIQLLLGVLIIIYSFQSFVFLFDAKEILKNELYIKYVKEYIEMANKFALEGTKVFESLAAFGFVLFWISFIIWLTFEVIGKRFKIESFFLGSLLIFTSLGFAFWSAIFWFVLSIASHYLKYYLFALPIGILGVYALFKGLKKLNNKTKSNADK